MISGPRALLMQAAHPLAVEGLLAHTSGLDAPSRVVLSLLPRSWRRIAAARNGG